MARSNITDISSLMQRLFPKTAKAGAHLERYPARVFLCAYMVLSHPSVVFNTQGELEDMLAEAGNTMLTAFEALLKQMAQPMHANDRSPSSSSVQHTLPVCLLSPVAYCVIILPVHCRSSGLLACTLVHCLHGPMLLLALLTCQGTHFMHDPTMLSSIG